IYQVRIAFRREYTTCDAGNKEQLTPAFEREQDDEFGVKTSIMGGERGIYWANDDPWWWGDDEEGDEEGGDDANPNEYNWSKRDDPCAKEYYNYDHFVQRNAFVSDLGLTAKLGRDGSLFMAVTDLHTTQPLSGIDIELFTYQLQPIVKIRTEGDGTVLLEGLREMPFVAVASGNNRKGYLRMADGNALSLSRFDVAGIEAQRGLKGYIYGERGVWRPGDSLFLNLVLEDKSGRLPAGHPVTMEVTDPRGAVQVRRTVTAGVHGVYPFYFSTSPEAPTGNWVCKVMVGGATFNKVLKIETVKPNRLKMDLNFGKTVLAASDFSRTSDGKGGAMGNLKVNWLHGAVAKGLKAKVEMTVVARKTEFPNYKGFSFDDPSRYFHAEPEVLFDAAVDQNGMAQVPLKIGQVSEAPGKLTANFKVRAFEQGGDFSTDNFNLEVSPYDRYVGVFVPTNRWGSKVLDQRGGAVTIAMVDKNGKPMANQSVNVALYRVDWRWWWDEDANSGVGNFNSGEVNNALDEAELTTDSRGQISWKVRPSGWGRYFVRVSDGNGSHAGGDFFWSGYPDELNDMASRNAAAMLPFTVEKEKYNVGEEVVLKVPASDKGRILLTLETGSRVARHFWFDAKAGDNLLKFTAEPDMAPTVYAHISLMQPHAQTVNDLPIRMYGVLPVNVEDPATRLTAQIDMPDVIKPGEFFNISLREMGGKACTYTVDVVDEGLLDLTRFKTPNPWETFYAREALGVKTWDIYDYVLGAYAVELERILAIGGDGINQKAKPAQVNRFKPAVLHLGPFRMEKGQVAKHRLKLDNYVGSVRVMAVLSNPPAGPGSGAYGNAEKTVPVRKPLMILPTLPRVLGPGETLKLPVDVFALEKSVQNAVISVREKTGLVSIDGAASTSLAFTEPGNKMVYFNLKVGAKSGVARFNVSAEGGGETSTSDIEIEIRNPNPVITRVIEGVVEPGQTWSQSGNPTDFTDLASAFIEISSIPPINLSKQLEYLIRYPHGCVEQTTSAVFPQLYVDMIAPLSDKQKQEVEKNIKAAIAKLQLFQMSSGAFAYWQGGNEVADWAGTYAGHFLMEAKARGYAVPDQMLNKWIEFQTKTSRTWEPGKDNDPHGWWHHDNELSQAYRLYTLALAGKPDLPGMNRMRESKNKYETTASLLAAAFASAGKKEAARDLLNDASIRKYVYSWWGGTYGSDLRDLALRLETLTSLGDNKRGLDVALQVANQVGNAARWYSTQEVATCLRAISKYAKSATLGDKTDFIVKNGNREMPVNSTTPYYLYNFTEEASGSLAVKNTSKQKLFVRAVFNGRPAITNQGTEAKNVSLNVRYTDLKGQVIDPSKIAQGTDFMAEVTVTRTGEMRFDFNEMALTEIFPSGWEIMNTRMNAVGGGASDPVDYQDIRDDRVMTYFDLPFNWSGGNAKQSRTYRIQLNAAYVGRYFLPPVACEAMYDDRIRASIPGRWVEVI
ncbi:MAG: alpha-2-macroglobulin, partial [Saprospiraceae bacterium]|nr:alpha-2-macroglobulin [Saprospiraceae bacterium]